MARSWYFPPDYLAEMEEMVRTRFRVLGKTEPKTVSLSEVLIQAQAWGEWTNGLVERHGGIHKWLEKYRDGPAVSTAGDDPDFLLALQFSQATTEKNPTILEDIVLDKVKSEPEPGVVAATWGRLQDIYNEKKPATWPATSRRLGIGQMSSRIDEGIKHAGSVAEFLSLFETALSKVPEFYRNEYVQKGTRKRPATDCILCLLSADKHHRELGVAGWRMFSWADLIETNPDTYRQASFKHPAEEFCKWTGTAWTHRGPFFELSEQEQQQKKRDLINAGLAPADA